MSDEIFDDFDGEEEFVLNVNEVKMLLDYLDGNSHMVNMDEFNSLMNDMTQFYEDFNLVDVDADIDEDVDLDEESEEEQLEE